MILGPLQFSSVIRERHLRWHRLSGRVFVTCGLVIGVSALVMSFGMPAIGGVNQAAATTLFGTFFLFALCKAFWHIRRREVALHREWMIRAFSIGIAVAAIRPIIGVFFATSPLTGLTPREFFGIAFWIGFVLHLIAAEAWIHTTPAGQMAAGLQQQFSNFPLPEWLERCLSQRPKARRARRAGPLRDEPRCECSWKKPTHWRAWTSGARSWIPKLCAALRGALGRKFWLRRSCRKPWCP